MWRVLVEVDLLAQKEYFSLMETVTLKIDKKHITLLREEAKALGRSEASVVRDLIKQQSLRSHVDVRGRFVGGDFSFGLGRSFNRSLAGII